MAIRVQNGQTLMGGDNNTVLARRMRLRFRARRAAAMHVPLAPVSRQRSAAGG